MTRTEGIIRRVARAHQMPVADLIGPSHAADICAARHMAMDIIDKDLNLSHSQIAAAFNRERSTVSSALDRIDILRKNHEGFAEMHDRLIAKTAAKPKRGFIWRGRPTFISGRTA